MSDEPILPSSSSPSDSEESSAARLPSDDPSGDRSARLPGDDASPPASAKLPADAINGAKEPAVRSLEVDEDVETEDEPSSLQDLIRELTATGGLEDAVPNRYEGPEGTFWESVEYDDPFTPLLLDPRQVEKITEAMVQNNARVLEAFWNQKTRLMRGGSGKAIARIYGGPDNSMNRVERHPKRIRESRDRLLDREARHREAKRLLEEQRQRIWAELQQEIQIVLQASEILPSQVEGMINRAESKGMTRETARSLLHERFKSEGYEAYDGDEVSGVRWMKPEEYVRREKQRQASQVKPIIIGGEKATTVDDLIDISNRKYQKARECFYNGYMDQWIGGILGNTSLGGDIANVRKGHEKSSKEEIRAIGFEVALRRLCERAGRMSKPRVHLAKDSVNFGARKFGKRLRYTIEVSNASPRRAWGKIRTSGKMKGLEVPQYFGITESSFDLVLETTTVRPGTYDGTVILDIKDGDTHTLSVSYIVDPVDIQVSPPDLHLGPVGTNVTKKLDVEMDSEVAFDHLSVHWANKWTVQPESPKDDEDWTPVEWTESRSGDRASLELTIKGKEIKDRQSLENAVVLRLPNEQFVRVPISFRCPWKYTTRISMIFGAVIFGTLFGFARQMFAERSAAFEGWALMPVLEFEALAATSLFALALVFVTAIPLLITARRDQQ